MFSGHTEGRVNDELAVKADYVIGIPDVIAKFTPNRTIGEYD